MSLILEAAHIWKSYNGNTVLRGCSFSFDKPGTYVLTGPNGCGKSTFLRICALLESPDRGEISFSSEGMPLKKDLALRRRITLVLPKVGVFNTTVFKNAAYGLKIREMENNILRERVTSALEFVGLLHKEHQNALTLSSGETQRLGIARAMIIEPEILFLDEPTASVDQHNTDIIEEIVLTMRRRRNTIVIMTTHDREQAERLADCLMVMKEGSISTSSGASSLLDNP